MNDKFAIKSYTFRKADGNNYEIIGECLNGYGLTYRGPRLKGESRKATQKRFEERLYEMAQRKMLGL